MIPAFLLSFASGIVGPKFAKLAVIGSAILLLIALLGVAKCTYDRSIISSHDAKVEASQAKADRAADQKAAVQATTDTNRENYEANQLQEAVKNAPHDPKIDDATERNLAFHKCLRLQQRARANGLEPPRCV